jgi:hypothetical protein
MNTILLVGLSALFALVAILVKIWVTKPQKLEPSEKAQILTQLLALSEQEEAANGVSRPKPALKARTPSRRPAPKRIPPSRTMRRA